MSPKKTIFFEDRFGVNIEDFQTTTEVDRFIEERTGKKLQVVRMNVKDQKSL